MPTTGQCVGPRLLDIGNRMLGSEGKKGLDQSSGLDGV
jgi:hypothetical protein